MNKANFENGIGQEQIPGKMTEAEMNEARYEEWLYNSLLNQLRKEMVQMFDQMQEAHIG